MALARRWVPATGIGPDTWPGFFGMSTLLAEHIAFTIEEKNRKGAVQWRICCMDTPFVHRPDGVAIEVEKDDVFGWRGDSRDGGHW
jgi:hypothetical protein